MNGYGNLFLRNAIEPVQVDLTNEAWTIKKESWTDKQERTCAVIRNRSGYNGRQIVADFTTVSTMIAKIVTHYRPSGSGVFTSLDRTYQDLRLSDCTNVSEYAERLRKAKNKLLELDSCCTIGHPHFVNKFLAGLGPDYDVFPCHL